jgi:diguanylate cyclase (GGDEF)-like protein
VFYLDLDDFKVVNDQHGYLVCDTILAAAADRLRSCARPGDLVARIGGDEFAVFCPGLDDLGAADTLAHRFVEAFVDPVTVAGVSAQLGVSVGIALAEGDAVADTILARADAQLLDAKSAGKGQVRGGPRDAS